MISIKHIGNESQLSSQYPDIEDFYNNTLKQHRISITDRLFLSVLELPAYKALESEKTENSETDNLNSESNTDSSYVANAAGSAIAAAAVTELANKTSDEVLLKDPYSYQETYADSSIKSFWNQNNQDHDDSETLVIVPGRAENEHKYAELLYNLKDSGLRIVVCFVRGQGQSSNVIYGSTKCHVEYFANYRHDLEAMLNYLNIGRNYKMLGFSLGGLISLDFCINGAYQHKPQALGLISPFLGVNFPIPSTLLYYTISTLCLIRAFALSYTPHGREYKRVPFEDNYHSHSMVRYNIYHDYYAAHPQQAIAGPSFNFVKCCMRAQRKIAASNFKFDFPVMCLSSELDKVVKTPDAQQFFAAHASDPVPPVFEIIQGAYHDVLNESDEFRNPTLAKILDFLFPNSVDLVDPKAELESEQLAQEK